MPANAIHPKVKEKRGMENDCEHHPFVPEKNRRNVQRGKTEPTA